MQLYVPFSEAVIERHGFSFGELVPFNAEYVCWHSYEIEKADSSTTVPRDSRDPSNGGMGAPRYLR